MMMDDTHATSKGHRCMGGMLVIIRTSTAANMRSVMR